MVRDITDTNRLEKNYPSLYNHFRPGERVTRIRRKDNGKIETYEGIIIALDEERMQIYWDTLDGEYNPEIIKDDFTLCHVDEIFNGTDKYSAIKHKKNSYIDWL
jgi:hypothetical protein